MTFALFGRGCSWSVELVGSGGRCSMVGCVHKDKK